MSLEILPFNVAVLVDNANVMATNQRINLDENGQDENEKIICTHRVDLRKLPTILASLVSTIPDQIYRVAWQQIYTPIFLRENYFIDSLKGMDYEVFSQPIKEGGNMDTNLCVGTMDKIFVSGQFPEIVFLVSGDQDFKPLMEWLQFNKVKVIVVSHSGMLSEVMKKMADNVIYFDSIWHLVKTAWRQSQSPT